MIWGSGRGCIFYFIGVFASKSMTTKEAYFHEDQKSDFTICWLGKPNWWKRKIRWANQRSNYSMYYQYYYQTWRQIRLPTVRCRSACDRREWEGGGGGGTTKAKLFEVTFWLSSIFWDTKIFIPPPPPATPQCILIIKYKYHSGHYTFIYSSGVVYMFCSMKGSMCTPRWHHRCLTDVHILPWVEQNLYTTTKL